MNTLLIAVALTLPVAHAGPPAKASKAGTAAKTKTAATSYCGDVPDTQPFADPGPTPEDHGDCATWKTRYTRKFALKADKTLDCGRLLLSGTTSCESHMCKQEKSVPAANVPKDAACTCTEWDLAGEQTCSRKDDKGVCVEWLGGCKKDGDNAVCETLSKTCVAMHCHPPTKKDRRKDN